MMKKAKYSVILFIVFGSLIFGSDSSPNARFGKIENSLIIFDTMANINNKEYYKSQPKHTIADRMAFYKVPAVSIALIKDYKIEGAKAYGVLKAGSTSFVKTETLFEAASTTKLLSGILILRLAEQGLIGLDEDVNKYLKSWKVPENEYTKENKVTLRLLLTHQSGLNSGSFSYEDDNVPSLAQVLRGEAPALNKKVIVESVPGEKHKYSNYGYVVIQMLIEDITGKSYVDIAQENVFGPLGMKDSTLVFPFKEEFKNRVTLPHDQEGKAYQNGLNPTAVAQGGLVTTPSDLAKLMLELMLAYHGKSEKLLSQKTVKLMLTQQPQKDPTPLFDGFTTVQGLGVLLIGEGDGFSFMHPGFNLPGATSVPIGFPNTGNGYVIMTNGANGIQLSMEIRAAIMNQ
jgi:CubicO group peptidase (beta-lactamase class C family)